ncbi:MAG: hypothetical protein ACREJB_08780, partial [Planctomycetaceae bacterium]
MDVILPAYDLGSATWFYLSLLLIVAVYFRFTRFWSLRNLDLALLLSLSPGLLFEETRPHVCYSWMFLVSGLVLLRLFCDGLFTRRPRLEQNLNVPGLAFLGVAALAFLITLAVASRPDDATMQTVRRADHLLHLRDSAPLEPTNGSGPASPILAAPLLPVSNVVAAQEDARPAEEDSEWIAARILAIGAHLAVVLGLIVFARWHFNDLPIGLAMATLYLLLPCTAYDVDEVIHVLPAALVLWAFVFYRQPIVAGGLMGLACGTLFFPVFLLPLWAVFYRRAGAVRFVAALAVVGLVLVASLAVTASDADSFREQVLGSIDWRWLEFQSGTGSGFWKTHDAIYRIPVFAVFLIVLAAVTVWPRRKTLEHLTAHSAALIVAAQFWYPREGGV